MGGAAKPRLFSLADSRNDPKEVKLPEPEKKKEDIFFYTSDEFLLGAAVGGAAAVLLNLTYLFGRFVGRRRGRKLERLKTSLLHIAD